jgi:hypothetical protein
MQRKQEATMISYSSDANVNLSSTVYSYFQVIFDIEFLHFSDIHRGAEAFEAAEPKDATQQFTASG